MLGTLGRTPGPVFLVLQRRLDLSRGIASGGFFNHVPILIHPEAKLSRITKAIQNFSARPANALLLRGG